MQNTQVHRGTRLSTQNASAFFHGPLDNLDELEKGDVSQIGCEPIPTGGASVRFNPAANHERTYYVREIVRGGFEHRGQIGALRWTITSGELLNGC